MNIPENLKRSRIIRATRCRRRGHGRRSPDGRPMMPNAGTANPHPAASQNARTVMSGYLEGIFPSSASRSTELQRAGWSLVSATGPDGSQSRRTRAASCWRGPRRWRGFESEQAEAKKDGRR